MQWLKYLHCLTTTYPIKSCTGNSVMHNGLLTKKKRHCKDYTKRPSEMLQEKSLSPWMGTALQITWTNSSQHPTAEEQNTYPMISEGSWHYPDIWRTLPHQWVSVWFMHRVSLHSQLWWHQHQWIWTISRWQWVGGSCRYQTQWTA